MEYPMKNIMESFSIMLDSKLATVKQDLSIIDAKLSSTKQDIFSEMKKEFELAIKDIKEEFTETTDFLEEQLKSFRLDIRTIDKKVKELESENQRLSTELHIIKSNQKSQPNTSEIQCRLDQLLVDINDRDQALLLNDIEISGVPEYTGESTTHVVQTVAQKLGVKLEPQDIVGVERVGPARAPGAGAVAAADARPRSRPLAVRLARRALRDEMLRNAKVRRGIDSQNIGLPEHTPQPIYINERLTKSNRRLFWMSRQAGRASDWKFVWTREGRIYAKRSDNTDTKAVNIKSEQDIQRVFGVVPTASDRK
ncbi:uncharacterized protein LOC134672904 [Cydia fagiglandana]|uniref:uncharacterized protein LOC134672904 n=1 Tax=Cydia fagiglandana TaxID=1458189 RepID=UPI002FEE099C